MTDGSLNDTDKWTNICRVNHARLLRTAMLLSCCGCIEGLLVLAEDQVKSSVVPDAFKYTFALRTVVKVCLSHVSRCSEMKELERGVGIEHRAQRLRGSRREASPVGQGEAGRGRGLSETSHGALSQVSYPSPTLPYKQGRESCFTLGSATIPST